MCLFAAFPFSQSLPQGAISDPSPYSETLFAALIDALPRGLTLWHGTDDMVLLANGTRLTIQNLTWAGAQGFQQPPTEPIVIDGKTRGECNNVCIVEEPDRK